MDKLTAPSQVKKQQRRNLIIMAVVVILILLSVSYLLDSKSSSKKSKDEVETIHFDTPLNHVDAQTIWVERAQNQLAQEGKETYALEQQLRLLQQSKENQEKASQQTAQTLQELQNKVEHLTQELVQKQNAQENSGAATFPPVPGQEGNSQNIGDGLISDDSLNLTPAKNPLELIPTKNPNTFVPAGTFVRAIMLGGADVSAGVTSQGNPSPMLFRILDQGTLPNHEHSHLKNCFATAAAVGDISSERGELRLERLSCTRPNGQVIELPVEATFFGPDGKNGMRGTPLWREGPLLARAFAAGIFSGLSNAIGQTYTKQNPTPLGPIPTVDNGKIFQFGLANGVANAAEKLADYNIQRAEQYHPVIQLSAGTVGDIVFLKGFYLDDEAHHNKGQDLLTSNHPRESEYSPTEFNSVSANQPSPLPLTAEQIQRLKQKNIEQGYQ